MELYYSIFECGLTLDLAAPRSLHKIGRYHILSYEDLHFLLMDDQDLQLVTSNLMPSLYSSLRELTLIGREHEGSTVCQCVSHE